MFVKYAAILVSSLAVHRLVEQCSISVISKILPKTYSRLQVEGKEKIFFGFFMGLVVTLISSPSCSYAAFEAWRCPQATWYLTPHAQVCAVARATLWLSELRTLNTYPVIMVHHAGSLLALTAWLTRRWSNLVFLTIFATLVSEAGGDLIFLLSAYRDNTLDNAPRLQSLRRTVLYLDTWQYGLIRGGGIALVCWKLYTDPTEFNPRSLAERLFGYALLLAYVARYVQYVFSLIKKSSCPKIKPESKQSVTNSLSN